MKKVTLIILFWFIVLLFFVNKASADGYLYGVSNSGTIYGYDITGSGPMRTILPNLLSPYSGLALGSDGYLYGITTTGTVYGYDVTGSGPTRILHSAFSSSTGLAIGSDGTLYGSGTNGSKVYGYDMTGSGHGLTLNTNLSGSSGLVLESSIVPEPLSSILFVTGGTLLAGRRLLRKKKKA